MRRDNTVVPPGTDRAISAVGAPDVRTRCRRRVLHLEVALPASAGDPDRDTLVRAMRAEGIPLVDGYARLLHELPIFARRIAFGPAWRPVRAPVSQRAALATAREHAPARKKSIGSSSGLPMCTRRTTGAIWTMS